MLQRTMPYEQQIMNVRRFTKPAYTAAGCTSTTPAPLPPYATPPYYNYKEIIKLQRSPTGVSRAAHDKLGDCTHHYRQIAPLIATSFTAPPTHTQSHKQLPLLGQ